MMGLICYVVVYFDSSVLIIGGTRGGYSRCVTAGDVLRRPTAERARGGAAFRPLLVLRRHDSSQSAADVFA